MSTPASAAMPACYRIRRQRNVRIPMADGVSLAADVFFPQVPLDPAAPTPDRFPVVFELLPYRKNDTTWDGRLRHRYPAERGIVAAYVEVRGTGDSEGVAEDEYCLQEQRDGVAIVAWLAAQPWSNGNVAMFGSSYSGFNALQVATFQPPALKAIVPMYFTDRRYTDDCHFRGGAMHMLWDVGSYGLMMIGRNLCPPRPDLVGDKWAAIWEEQLTNEPWVLRWLAHHTENEQWLNGSIFTDYSSIQAATYMIGAWRNGYANPVLRCFQHLSCSRKALIGPWMHTYPSGGLPGPPINYVREMARWFAHWLARVDSGIVAEPPIAIYVQTYDPPRPDAAPTASDGYDDVASVGTTHGICTGPNILPADQREEELRSLTYTSAPLAEPLEILGHPRAILHVSTTVLQANVVARLSEVAPEGQSALVTVGVLNLTHRDSHADPTPVEPGVVYAVEVELDCTSWDFQPGHCLRLAPAGSDFPTAWPSPWPHTTHVHRGAATPSRLVLPVVPAYPRALPAPDLENIPTPDPPRPPSWAPPTTGPARPPRRRCPAAPGPPPPQRSASMPPRNRLWHGDIEQDFGVDRGDHLPDFSTIDSSSPLNPNSASSSASVGPRISLTSSSGSQPFRCFR